MNTREKKLESHSPYAGTKILMNYSPYSAIMIGNCVVLSFIIPPLPLEPFLMQSCSFYLCLLLVIDLETPFASHMLFTVILLPVI